ncbi:hypothetical protein FB451DRAFT_1294581 [Mycena latifolia]|nr:hypothetical protein FB451DRAFT_1294581 [Mycena latifolia]
MTPEFPAALLPQVEDSMQVDSYIPQVSSGIAATPGSLGAEALPTIPQAGLVEPEASSHVTAPQTLLPPPAVIITTTAPSLPPQVTQPSQSTRGRIRISRDIGDLSLCICGDSAEPSDPRTAGDVARCKRNGCETKWYHLDCIGFESVTDAWVCDACIHSGAVRGTKRRRTGR